jgi:hypothetical protein
VTFLSVRLGSMPISVFEIGILRVLGERRRRLPDWRLPVTLHEDWPIEPVLARPEHSLSTSYRIHPQAIE